MMGLRGWGNSEYTTLYKDAKVHGGHRGVVRRIGRVSYSLKLRSGQVGMGP